MLRAREAFVNAQNACYRDSKQAGVHEVDIGSFICCSGNDSLQGECIWCDLENWGHFLLASRSTNSNHLMLNAQCWHKHLSPQQNLAKRYTFTLRKLLLHPVPVWCPDNKLSPSVQHPQWNFHGCHKHPFTKFCLFPDNNKHFPDHKIQSVRSISGFSFYSFIKTDNHQHIFLLLLPVGIISMRSQRPRKFLPSFNDITSAVLNYFNFPQFS